MGTIRRDLDPETGDYVVELGAPRGDSTRASKVVLRLRKRRGTGVYPHVGSRLHTIEKNAPGALHLAEHYALEAVEDLIRAREITAVTATATAELIRGSTYLVVELAFTDTAGDKRTARYERPLGG